MGDTSVTGALKVIARLYCCEVCSEFRKPIGALYPHLAAEYYAVVAHPVDLSSLMLRCMKEGTIKTPELRQLLQLMVGNARAFNKGQVLMENIATHVESYASGLFDEILKIPWDGLGGVVNIIKRRRARFQLLEMEFLHDEELSELATALSSTQNNVKALPSARGAAQLTEFKDAIEQCLKICSWATATSTTKIRLHTVFKPLLQFAIKNTSSSSGDSFDPKFVPAIVSLFAMMRRTERHSEDVRICSASSLSTERRSLYVSSSDTEEKATPKRLDSLEFPSLHIDALGLLAEVDAAVGELLVVMEERVTRGSAESHIWARPLEALWAKPEHKSKVPWWPCIVIGGGAGTCISRALTEVNLSRLPFEVVKQLQRRCSTFSKPPPSQESRAVSARVFRNGELEDQKARLTKVQLPPADTSALDCEVIAEVTDSIQKAESAILLSNPATTVCPLPTTEFMVPANSSIMVDRESRPANSGSPPLTIPYKCVIVEFFNDHDLGFVRIDSALHMSCEDPAIPAFPLINAVVASERVTGEGARKDAFECFSESIQAITAMPQSRKDLNFSTLPKRAQLEHSLELWAARTPLLSPKPLPAVVVSLPGEPRPSASMTTTANGSPRGGAGTMPLTESSESATISAREAHSVPLGTGRKMFRTGYPLHSNVVFAGSYHQKEVPVKALRVPVTAVKRVLASGRTIGGDDQTSKMLSQKKHRALVRTRVLLEWLEATSPLETMAQRVPDFSVVKTGGSPLQKETHHHPTPLALQLKDLIEVPAACTAFVEPAKRISFRGDVHLNDDCSKVDSCVMPTCHFVSGMGLINTRRVALDSPIFMGESASQEERIAILQHQSKEFDLKLVNL